MVRNFIDLVEEVAMRTHRVPRKGIRMGSFSEYALLPRVDGTPDWVPPDVFDMLPDTCLRRAKFAPRSDAQFENGLINNALKGGSSFSP